MKEIEARWINQNPEEVLKKLKAAGAAEIGDCFFKEWIFQYPEWRTQERRIRVRTDGTTHWLTYKANKTWEVDSTEEVEFTISSAEKAVHFLKAIEIPCARYQEKKRKSFSYNKIIFDLDFWPKIPMVLEIEAPSKEKVEEGAKLLGLKWDEAIFEDQRVVHQKYYGIDLFQIADYRFESK